MDLFVPGRPDTSEYAPHAKAYVDCVIGENALEVLERQLPATLALFRSLDENLSYAPGKWTAKQTLGHVIDTERIFAYRILRIGRGDATALPGFEQDDYVNSGAVNHRRYEDLLEEFGIVRQSSLVLYRSLMPEDWKRRGTASGQPVTVRGLIFTSAGHELHHVKILQQKYVPLTGLK